MKVPSRAKHLLGNVWSAIKSPLSVNMTRLMLISIDGKSIQEPSYVFDGSSSVFNLLSLIICEYYGVGLILCQLILFHLPFVLR